MDSDQVTDAFIRRHGDAIEAGECGPVMRQVHEAYWEYGSDGIPTPKEKATVDAGTAVAAAMPVWGYAESSDVGDA